MKQLSDYIREDSEQGKVINLDKFLEDFEHSDNAEIISIITRVKATHNSITCAISNLTQQDATALLAVMTIFAGTLPSQLADMRQVIALSQTIASTTTAEVATSSAPVSVDQSLETLMQTLKIDPDQTLGKAAAAQPFLSAYQPDSNVTAAGVKIESGVDTELNTDVDISTYITKLKF